MKRHSPKPFAVEYKHGRTKEGDARILPQLWPDKLLDQAREKQPRVPAPAARVEATQEYTPLSRRILPALTPIFSPREDNDEQVEAKTEASMPSAPRKCHRVKRLAVQPATATSATKARETLPPVIVAEPFSGQMAAASAYLPRPQAVGRRIPKQSDEGKLRLGQRWKRRLSRYAR